MIPSYQEVPFHWEMEDLPLAHIDVARGLRTESSESLSQSKPSFLS